jgi:outer membrane protein assembly factor BamB
VKEQEMMKHWTYLRLSGCLAVIALTVGCPAKSPQPVVTAGAQATDPVEPQNLEDANGGADDRVVTGDWPMWGGTIGRNMSNATTGISIDFTPATDPKEGKNLLWVAMLGSQTYGNPVVADGRVFVGTNNGGNYRPKHKGDRGCLLTFDENTGEFLWQLTREKLPQGRISDWPEQGICSTPCVEGDYIFVVTNRAELMCLDVNGFYDDENDGPYEEEIDSEKQDADIVWSLDMIEELGVFPHNLATSSPIIIGDLVFLLTSNGVEEAHKEVPAPRSPCFLAVNKNTGEVVWEDNTPFDKILHGQWSSPAGGIVNGKAQVYMAGGDGWLYALDAETGKHVWKFDLNPKDSEWELGGRGTRNSIISTPVFFEGSVFLAVGQDPEHGEGVGHLYRIDASKSGDVSPVTPDGKPNPNSAQIWHVGGIDTDGKVTGREGEYLFRRSISSVAIHDGLVYAPDLTGYLHCLDLETGERYWEHDTLAAIWGSPMYADGKILMGDEDGDLVILEAGKTHKVLAEKMFTSSIYSTPTIANGKIFVSDRSRLYVFDTK